MSSEKFVTDRTTKMMIASALTTALLTLRYMQWSVTICSRVSDAI